MTPKQIIMIVTIIALLAILVIRRGGPRVTHIDRTVRRKGSDDA